ncbi:MAG TPA: 16S rRNA (uracil(1498)-N(3))-methyltransferase [Xanthomonadaceae bacterium]|jgi:16S rRNA (uracil1498-N3)-methyltransferase|nr:16S rRNA (uracil(1498)-N(3))-methyltransferase [Xanthomonadaceae bacterium]
MRIPRVFLAQPLRAGDTIELPSSACEHLLRVMRLPEGASLVLCNGDGMDYRARLAEVGRRSACAHVLDAAPNLAESPSRIVLAQALARGEKMDWVIQKATELGVAAIAPIITERTEVRLDSERANRRLAHWQGVATAGCEQSGRSCVPDIAEPQTLAAYLAGVAAGTIRLALDPEGEPPSGISELHDEHAPRATIHLVVGPEGGLSDRDLTQLRAAGFRGLRLGPRILRTETAGLAALAVLQAKLGDLR